MRKTWFLVASCPLSATMRTKILSTVYRRELTLIARPSDMLYFSANDLRFTGSGVSERTQYKVLLNLLIYYFNAELTA